jgi:hypothetical protein
MKTTPQPTNSIVMTDNILVSKHNTNHSSINKQYSNDYCLSLLYCLLVEEWFVLCLLTSILSVITILFVDRGVVILVSKHNTNHSSINKQYSNDRQYTSK